MNDLVKVRGVVLWYKKGKIEVARFRYKHYATTTFLIC